MERFHIWDVVSVLGLPGPVSGKSSYCIPCPDCDRASRSRHLNINLRKEVYRCPKCGLSGGIFDLYALYTGVPRDRVRSEMLERLGRAETSGWQRSKQPELPENRESPLAPIEVRHKTYKAMLGRLTLAPDHRDNLRSRGLTDAEIRELSYRTLPVRGMEELVQQLKQDGFRLAGVPGFYRNKSNQDESEWHFTMNRRGILIPVRDIGGRIQGLQLRLDDTAKRKFRWVSSGELTDGCKACGWTHLAGAPAERILITEGPMKADIIHALTGQAVLAVPGVSTLTQLGRALEGLKELGLKMIMTAFDMDMLTNPHVQKGYGELLRLLSEMGFSFGTYLWDRRYKGLDDYIWETLMKRNR